ncbi:MAG TPA: YezD family protein [Lysobacter sp.]|nr:YezD family protein [Lysobacter sp.]
MTTPAFPPRPSERPAARLALPVNEAEQAVLAALRELRYGSVEVVVHSDRIVQITRSQKLRVDGR